MGAVGGGYVWPATTFVSDGEIVAVHSRPTTDRTIAPIRFLHEVHSNVTASSFETAIDSFVGVVLGRLANVGEDRTELADAMSELREERLDRDTSAWRKLEALLGFDPDDGDEVLLRGLTRAKADAGRAAIEELAAASREFAMVTLDRTRHHLKHSMFVADRPQIDTVQVYANSSFDDVILTYRPVADEDVQAHVHPVSMEFAARFQLPWQRAHRAAREARNVWGIAAGPVSDETLAGILKFPKAALSATPDGNFAVSAGERQPDDKSLKVLLRSHYPENRRFELMRIVADDLWAEPDDRLLPVTRTYTARQKFQRAFAQEFLLPEAELLETLGNQPADDDAIDEIAHQYQVSSMVVRTALVNRGHLSRDDLAA